MITLLIFSLITYLFIIIENGSIGLLYVFLILIISIPFYALAIYNIDCLSKGSCETWSWILVIINVIYTFIVILAGIISSLSNNGNSIFNIAYNYDNDNKNNDDEILRKRLQHRIRQERMDEIIKGEI